jgi:hypothetical protein
MHLQNQLLVAGSAPLNPRKSWAIAEKIDLIYRDCQEFATPRIKKAVEDVLLELIIIKTSEERLGGQMHAANHPP